MQKQNFHDDHTPITVWLPKPEALRLRIIAAEKNLTRSELIRRACREYLASPEGAKQALEALEREETK